jgi:hypothetical protein
VPRISPFVYGHVLAALLIGAAAGYRVDYTAIAPFAGAMVANAVLSSIVCWWWPGLQAPGWKLWPMAAFVNPLMVLSIAYSIQEYDCLMGRHVGWNCLLDEVGLWVAGFCLPSPLVGLVVRWLVGLRRA